MGKEALNTTFAKMQISKWKGYFDELAAEMGRRAKLSDLIDIKMFEHQDVARNYVMIGVDPHSIKTLENGLRVGNLFVLYHPADHEAAFAEATASQSLRLTGIETVNVHGDDQPTAGQNSRRPHIR